MSGIGDNIQNTIAASIAGDHGMRRVSRLRRFRSFLKDSAGNVTVMTSMALIPIIALLGAAVDYGRLSADRVEFQSAVDAALLAVVTSGNANFSGLSQAQINERTQLLKKLALGYIYSNYDASDKVKSTIGLTLGVTDGEVSISASHTQPSSLSGIAGFSDLTQTINSKVKKAPRPVELALVMDTTGSMGTTYMAQAKSAAHTLLNTIYGGTLAQKPDSQYIRTALVPFSAAVRLNQNAYDFNMSWIDTTGASSVSAINFIDPATGSVPAGMNNYTAWGKLKSTPWNGCVESRPGSYATSDDPPAGGNSLFVPYFAPDEPTFSNSTSSYGYYNSYISTSGTTPNELTGFTSSTDKSTSSSLSSDMTTLLRRQNNASKYNNVSISNEASSSYGPWFNCAATSIVPLTYKRANVEAAIDLMTSSGSTVIPEGVAWGWKVLSPTEPFTKVEAGPTNPATTISPYGDPRWRKIMVLMTDGENDVLSSGSSVNSLNGGWYSAYGRIKATSNNRFGTTSVSQSSTALDNNMLTLCTNAKAQGIEIYTVAFRVSSSNILDNLKECATDDDHAKTAADGVALGKVFSNIALNVANATIYLSK